MYSCSTLNQAECWYLGSSLTNTDFHNSMQHGLLVEAYKKSTVIQSEELQAESTEFLPFITPRAVPQRSN